MGSQLEAERMNRFYPEHRPLTPDPGNTGEGIIDFLLNLLQL
jgi:hypothetical protein